MKDDSERWEASSESPHPWEREALAFVRERLPDHEPYHAWANFEFVTHDGRIYEVDLLVMTPKGLFLVEIKSRPGIVSGDAQNWIWETDGRERRMPNPLLLANRKAKCLKSLLEGERTFRSKRKPAPWIEPLVFLSAEDLELHLDPRARSGVHLRDRDAAGGAGGRHGIVHALKYIDPADYASGRGRKIDRPMAKLVLRAMGKIGIKEVRRERRVHDYKLGDLLLEGPGYQDFEGTHASLDKLHRRVRIYGVSPKGGGPSADTVKRAARREFRVLHDLEHPGILRAREFTESDLGPALLFDHSRTPAPMRLDYYLAKRGGRLSLDVRLSIVRQLAEALQYAHAQKLVHRGLSPESVLVRDPGSDSPELQIFNWQTAAREIASESGTHANTHTRHLDDLVSGTARVYLAPEALSDPDAMGETLDVFSLGAITYHVFTNRPPASDHVQLHSVLKDQGGLRLAADVDGACQSLEDLVELATSPNVSLRIDSMKEFLEKLEEVEDELTSPDDDAIENPADARPGDKLEGGFEVRRRLGSGSTSIVFEVDHLDGTSVLKLARNPELNDRLMKEAEVLDRLRHAHIVALEKQVLISGHTGLLLNSAGEDTLRDRLRGPHGPTPLSNELLQRFGEDLLQILQFLEQQGVPHRDIKPENLGVKPVGRGDSLHLVLFDFSLARVPVENISAGTPGYLDPFLANRTPRRWDVSAEHFAAAVTLHEMASGRLPIWGDGRSDPALIDDEVTIDADLIDSSLRRPIHAFFEKALRRDPAERFDNVEEMLRAWRKVFEEADRPSDHGDTDMEQALQEAVLDTPVVALPFSARAQSALERTNVLDVRGLLETSLRELIAAKGVGQKTKKELIGAVRVLAERFPAEARDDETDTDEGGEASASLDRLAWTLIPSRARSAQSTELAMLRGLLGLDTVLADVPRGWASQTDLATKLGKTRARVGQLVKKARERWRRFPAITAIRDELEELLQVAEGALTADEAVRRIAALRGGELSEDEAASAALAVVRAATEVEGRMERPRWLVRRGKTGIVLALETAGGLSLASYAESLGVEADRLALDDPLPSPQRVEAELRAVPVPDGVAPLSHQRLVRLAAATSTGAAASPRLELYPVGMPAARALRLARGALLGARSLPIEALQRRVRARYPKAAPLPGRPELDELLAQAGLDLRWSSAAAGGLGAYGAPTLPAVEFTPSRTSLPRYRTLLEPIPEVPPEIADARQFEDRLLRYLRDGAFFVLCVSPDRLAKAEQELAKKRFGVTVVRLDALLLDALREICARRNVKWDVVLKADAEGPEGRDWRRVLRLFNEARETVEADLLARAGTLLLTDAWLVARYEQMSLFERLRDAVGARTRESDVRLQGAWLLIGSSDGRDKPMLAGQPIALLTRAQWARIPEPWLQNLHRSGKAGLAAATAGPTAPEERP